MDPRRVLAVSISKLYSSRSQRGGLKLHRSLLLSLLMRTARDLYHATAPAEPSTEPSAERAMEAMEAEVPKLRTRGSEDKENQSPKRPLKRPGKAAAVPDFLPEKRARLERDEATRSPGAGSGAACRSLGPLPLLTTSVISAF